MSTLLSLTGKSRHGNVATGLAMIKAGGSSKNDSPDPSQLAQASQLSVTDDDGDVRVR